jgi:predicted TIM-barrel fold metal-dependent hydrolase
VILDRARVESYLALAQRVGRQRTLYDVHVSPYEVIFHELDHGPNPDHPGVYSLEGARYRPPRPGPLRIHDAQASDKLSSRAEVPRELSMMMMRKQYAHMGPRVVADGMALSGIGESLLIPVWRPGADPDEQARSMLEIYGDDPRFAFAYCPALPADEAAIVAEIRAVTAAHPLRAIKINANIQGIDLSSSQGREAMERLMAACRSTALPMIVHGGISRLLPDPAGRAFASLDKLAALDWQAAGVPVVISHAGLFGCSSSEVEALLPVLTRMLDRHERLLVDVSGLSVPTLDAVLGALPPSRMVFGSDALYFPQWSAVVKLLHAMDRRGMPVEETFATVAGDTPARHIFHQEPG